MSVQSRRLETCCHGNKHTAGAALAGAGLQPNLAVGPGRPAWRNWDVCLHTSVITLQGSELCGSLPITGHQGNRELILPAHPRPCLRPWAQSGASGAPGRGVQPASKEAWAACPSGIFVKTLTPTIAREDSGSREGSRPSRLCGQRETQAKTQPESVSFPGWCSPHPRGRPTPTENTAKASLFPWARS